MALRLELGLVSTPLHAFDVVMDGSVAQALSRRGRRLLLFLSGRGDESRLVRRCVSNDGEAIPSVLGLS